MKTLTIASILLLASCQTARTSYVNYGEASFTADRDVNLDDTPTLEVGLTYGDSGLVSDVSLRAGDGKTTFPTGTEVDIESLGLKTGLRYNFDTGTILRPYLGAAILTQHTWLSSNLASDDKVDKTKIGGMGTVGLDVQVQQNMTVGISYHFVNGIVLDIDDDKLDLNSEALMFGFSWTF